MYQTLNKYAISTRRCVFYSVFLKMYAVSSVSGGRGEDVYREGGGTGEEGGREGRRGEEENVNNVGRIRTKNKIELFIIAWN
jgi:hypothetical protein